MLDTVLSALRGGDYAAAETAARAWLADRPDEPQAEHLLGVSLQARGQLDAADAAFGRALALAPERAETHIARALLAAHRRDPAAARAALDRAVAQDPNQLIAYLSLAQLALARGDLPEAERQLRVAERINAEHPHLLALHGQLLLARGQGEAALSVLTQAAQLAPDDSLVQGVLGMTLLALGRHAFAEQALRNALALQPDATALRHALLRALLAQNRHDEADVELGVLLNETPDDAAALALQGQLARTRGDLLQARERFERSLQARPHPGVLRALQGVLQELGAPHDLAAVLEQVLARHPAFDPAWVALLELARGDGAWSATIADRWYTASPTPAATELLAQVCEARGDHGRAAELAQSAVARDPARVASHIVLARAALRTGDAAGAVTRLQAIVAHVRDPQHRRALLGWLGHALDRSGDHAGAAAAWREAQRLTPSPVALPAHAARPALVEAALARADGLAPAATPAPILLWAPPGSSPELAAALLRGADTLQLVADRFSATPRRDGFTLPDGIDLYPATLEGAADEFVTAWRAGLTALGHAPETSVDWLPHLDARVLPMLRAAASGTRIVAILRDPRDLLLNWLAFGSPQRYDCGDLVAAARWLAGALDALVTLRERALLPLLELGHGVAEGDLATTADTLADFLALPAAPHVAAAQRLRDGPLALPTAFADGHWRHYAAALADAFAPLGAVAQRLGYPAA
ncbi:tetratricopeptide repeat protein [Chiayiivirga flava]|uniref:Flp pilus assembly protein TadD n=1 Tax=Chiayiivirga flava TaxID=659595 RepID=A0A7W8G0B4_9GAMM|nr:tetratricopeptide repeat protein [Chiayiivirga flava]MBB5207548.1 Flp pilus assembly protein TadD [Chiayiivirga flava]